VFFAIFHTFNRALTPRGDANNKNRDLGDCSGPCFIFWVFISRNKKSGLSSALIR